METQKAEQQIPLMEYGDTIQQRLEDLANGEPLTVDEYNALIKLLLAHITATEQ